MKNTTPTFPDYTPAPKKEKKPSKGLAKAVVFGVGGLIVGGIFGIGIGNTGDDSVTTTATQIRVPNPATVTATATETVTAEPEATESPESAEPVVEESAEATPEATETPEATATPEAEADIPWEWENALASAESYLSWSNFSYNGLYNQLTSEYGEGFPADAAQYAMDNIEVDWNEQALASAESYLSWSDMSLQGVYDQLVSEYGEDFTPEQAQYAIDNL